MQESSDNLKLNNGHNTLSSRAHNFNTRIPAIPDNDYAPNNHNSIFATNSVLAPHDHNTNKKLLQTEMRIIDKEFPK